MANATELTGAESIIAQIEKSIKSNLRKINKYNDQYKTEESSETGPRALFTKGKELVEAGSAEESVVKAHNAYDDVLQTLANARQDFVNAVAASLGIEAPVEKPKPSKTEYEAVKAVRAEVEGAFKTLDDLSKFDTTGQLAPLAKAVHEKNPVPSLARPEIERKVTSFAPKYRVDVRTTVDGEEVTFAGFTKVAQKLGKNGPTADQLRAAYVSAGGPDKAAGEHVTDVTHNGQVFVLTNRAKKE